jgi:hypothetical protein
MKTLFYTACLLLVLSGYSQWQAFALQVVELARQQLPQPIADFFPASTGVVYRKETSPGLEGEMSARLEDALRRLSESGGLHDSRVTLKQVRYVALPMASKPAAKAANRARRAEEIPTEMPAPGHYVAFINYDLISPLTMESGINLVAAAYSLGIAEVRLSDGYGVVKTFQMPQLRN